MTKKISLFLTLNSSKKELKYKAEIYTTELPKKDKSIMVLIFITLLHNRTNKRQKMSKKGRNKKICKGVYFAYSFNLYEFSYVLFDVFL